MNVSLISVDNDIVAHGIRSISAVLKKGGHKTRLVFLPLDVYDRQYDEATLNSLCELVKDADVLGVTSMTLTECRAGQVIDFLKKKTGKPIAFGGAHPTLMPEQCTVNADVICRGEGEPAMLEYVNRIERGRDYSDIPGLWVRKGKEIIKNPIGQLVEDLDEYGIPDYDIENHFVLKKEGIAPFTEDLFIGMHAIHTMRGCPHSCTYCCNNFFRQLNAGKGKIIRQRSIDNVIEELVMIKAKFKSITKVWITDDTFIYRSEEELKRFSELYKAKIGLPYICYVSPKTVTQEKLDILVDSGLNYITIGIQSGSDDINRNLYKRMIFASDVLKAAEMLKKHQNKITLDYQLIITNPYEKEADLLKTIDLLRKLPKPYILETFNLAFFKGTELYERAIADCIVKSPEDTAVDLHFYDLIGHLRRKKNVNYYLNSLLFSMNGRNTDKRYGYIPAFMLGFLTSKPVVKFNNAFRLPTTAYNYLRAYVIQVRRASKKKTVSI